MFLFIYLSCVLHLKKNCWQDFNYFLLRFRLFYTSVIRLYMTFTAQTPQGSYLFLSRQHFENIIHIEYNIIEFWSLDRTLQVYSI